MLLSPSAFIILIIVIALFMYVAAFLLLRKTKFNKILIHLGVLVVLAFGSLYFILEGSVRVYIVTRDNKMESYIGMGHPTIQRADGTTFTIEESSNRTVIINDSEKTVVFEKLVYGTYKNTDELVKIIEPKSTLTHKKNVSITYGIGERIPYSIKSDKGGVLQFALYFQ